MVLHGQIAGIEIPATDVARGTLLLPNLPNLTNTNPPPFNLTNSTLNSRKILHLDLQLDLLSTTSSGPKLKNDDLRSTRLHLHGRRGGFFSR